MLFRSMRSSNSNKPRTKALCFIHTAWRGLLFVTLLQGNPVKTNAKAASWPAIVVKQQVMRAVVVCAFVCCLAGLLAVDVGNTLFTLNLPRGIKGEHSKLKGTKFQYGVASLLTIFHVRTYVARIPSDTMLCFSCLLSYRMRRLGNLKACVFRRRFLEPDRVWTGHGPRRAFYRFESEKDNRKQPLLACFKVVSGAP